MKRLLDLTDLRLFVNVAQAGNITAGASASHLSLAAASGRIIGLEQVLHTALLVRGRRGVTPTPAGEVLLEHARTLLKRVGELQADVDRVARRQVTRVRLVGNSSAVREYVPDALGTFLSEHPDVNVELEEMVPAAAVAAVRDGAADLAVALEGTPLQGLQAVAYRAAAYAVLVPDGHPMLDEATCGPVTMESTDRHGVVGLLEGSPLQLTWEARAARRGNQINYRVRVPGFEAQARVVEQGVGIALMPRATAVRLACSWRVKVVPMADPFLNEGLLLCARDWSALSPVASELVRTLLSRGDT